MEAFKDTPHGFVSRYTEQVPNAGRWRGTGSHEQVMWRAVPKDRTKPITYHTRRRDALAALVPNPEGSG